MQVISSEIIKGGIYARLLIEKEDIAATGDPRAAVEKAIVEHGAARGASSLLFIRVTEMDEQSDGGIIISFDAAIAPKVILGQYKDLNIRIGHNEDFEEAALNAAAANMSVELPEIVVEHKIDTLVLETQSKIYDSISLNTLADVYDIIRSLNADLGIEQTDEEVWQDAMAIAESYLNTGVQDLDAFAEAIGEFSEADSGSIADAVFRRAKKRSRMDLQTLGAEIFEALLHTEGKTMERWRYECRELAELRCRVDFLINAVAEAEDPEINEEEFKAAAAEYAANYQVSVDELISAISKEAILRQLKAIKARQLIVDSAKG